MAKAVGLDIGSRACKVIVLEGGPKGGKVLRYVEQEYEYGPGEALTPATVLDALRKALSKAKAPKQAVSYALPAEQCILREISVPFNTDDQIRKVVKFEFEPHLHTTAIEDVIIDYVKTGPARTGTRLLIFAGHKDLLTRKLGQLRQAGVDPLHVDVDMAALYNVADASGVFEEHPNCLIIDIGARTTKALFCQDGRIKVGRSIRLGASTVRKRVEADLDGDVGNVTIAMNEALSAEALALPPEGIADTVQIVRSIEAVEGAVARTQQDDFMARVLRETQRTLSAVSEEGRPTAVFLTGGGASHENARERIGQHFGVDVLDLPVLDAVEHKLDPEVARQLAASGAVALGTGLKVLGRDAGGIDFRQEDFRFARTFDQIKTALATGVTLLFFAIFLAFLIQMIESQKAGAEAKRLRQKIEDELRVDVFDAYQEAVTDAAPLRFKDDKPGLYVRTVEDNLKKVRGKLKDELGLATEVPPILSGLKTWAAVMSAIREVRGKVKYLAIKSEKYEQDKAVLTVVVGAYSDIDTITKQLRAKTDVIASVDSRAPKQDKEGRLEAPIEMELVPPDWERTETSATGADGSVRTAAGDKR